MIASSSMESTVAFGPVGRSATKLHCFHVTTVFWLMQ